MSIKHVEKIVGSAGHSLLASTILNSVADKGHGDKWSVEYFDKKFETVAASLELMQSEMNQIEKTTTSTRQIKRVFVV